MRTVILAGLLTTGALAVPELSHRALQRTADADTGVDSVIAAMLEPAIKEFGMDLVTELTMQVAQNSATGTNQLWFRSFDAPVPSLQRCGEIDAAPYMPASLFEPRNFLSLVAYAEATVRLYRTPSGTRDGRPVELGRCAAAGYSECRGGVQGISWFSNMMGPVCGERCQCNFNGQCSPAGNFPGIPQCSGLPFCRDVADDPTNGEFCSLCSPSTACPGCSSGSTVTIGLCYPPSEPPPPPPPAPTPPPPPPPAPPTPNADNHLWFYFVNTQNGFNRCGEVDAAPLMPEDIFKPRNVLELAAYVEATTRFYSVTFAQGGSRARTDVTVQLGRCRDNGYTVRGENTGNYVRPGSPAAASLAATAVASWTPSSLMTPVCEAECNCAWPTRNNAYPQPGDLPLCGHDMSSAEAPRGASGSFCGLCGDAACPINPAGCGQQSFGIGDGVNIDLYYRSGH